MSRPVTRRNTLVFLLAPAAALTLDGSIRADPPVTPMLTALLFYATDGDGKEAAERIVDAEHDVRRHERVLRKASEAKNFFLIGKHSAEAQSRFSIWLKPSPQFPLQLENTGTTADGGLSLYWILWQKEPLPIKDRELVKSTIVLTTKSPLVIVGPKWRSGRLIFVVRRES
ncbi:MAG: hypothetical protein ACKV19_08975 [Verrucomicrobiales bacterium]